ncbi:MAG TPA: hypothetical protein VFV05_23150, partial [Methylomirabilota bacterium]|nr:hypothetical protein [Methylomirabilota bacterium]
MIKEREIRERLVAYLDGADSVREFSRWLHSTSWNMEADSPPSAQALASDILARLAEHSSVGFSEDDLRAALLPIASKITTVWDDQPVVRTASSSQ